MPHTTRSTIDTRTGPFAAAGLRVGLGLVFLAHGVVLKLLTFGLPATARFFESVGLPGPLGYVTFAAEAVGGAMLVLGVGARWAALGLLPFVLGATAVHLPHGWLFENDGGGWEYPALLALLCAVVAALGDGALALAPSRLPGFVRDGLGARTAQA